MRKELTHKENILLKIKHLNDVVDNTKPLLKTDGVDYLNVVNRFESTLIYISSHLQEISEYIEWAIDNE
jgi:hypothetical protein